MVNIPDFTLKVVRDGHIVWTTKIVVGKPGNLATPITSAYMQYITVNPTWNVPPSIIQNEYLPALRQDPTVLQRMGLKLIENRDGTIHIYQPPGDGNALGRLRFNFPNKFLVYQHDTPDKHLFAHDKRAYSHGCMRVQDPLKYAEVLLGIVLPKENYTQERIRKMFGSAEVDIRFPVQIPVHLTYQTASVDDAGKLIIREDIYSRDARILAALKGEERRVADVAIERPKQTVSREALRMVPDRYDNPFAGFFRLFR
jgi:murein L,D-transpeptidase YcbB/YkuD